ncbi:MAG: type IV toxin-antitoxin system AbiEi family antitoxin [Propionicimonas sp.]|nr:type IV toxin-antitoxin system AbiEi family antitoxin [Propionicimonas sp.]
MYADVQNETLFSYIEHMGLLNTQGDELARLVQHGLVRAGMKDVTALSVQPSGGRRLVLRHGSSLHRVQVHPVGRSPRTPEDEPGWLPLLVNSGFDDATVHRLADAGASFLDERGNTHLVLDGRTVLFTRADQPGRTGMPAKVTSLEAKAKRAPGALALNRASHRVAFALLANPDLAASPVRALAAAARASIGTVHNTLAQLTGAGLLLDGQLREPGRLLDAWAESYRMLAVRPLSPRALYAADDRWSSTVRAEAQDAILLGGIAAAAVLNDQVRATDGIVYAATLGPAVTLLRLRADPTPFRVEVRERFWGDNLPTPQLGLVPSVLIYGDLLRDGDSRSLEVATNLRTNDAHLRTLG